MEIPTFRRCDSCRIGHRQCDGVTPACSVCAKRGKECTYNNASPPQSQKRDANAASQIKPIAPGSACLVCRNKKRKCDGERPVCGPCDKRGLECRFGSAVKQSIKRVNNGDRSSSAANENGSGHPRKFPRLSPPPSIVQRGQRKSLSAKDGDKQSRNGRSFAGTVISSMRAATSSISDVASNSSSGSDGSQQDAASGSPLQHKTEPLSPPPLRQTGKQLEQEATSPSVQLTYPENGNLSDGNEDVKLEKVSFMAGLKQAIMHRTDTSKPGSSTESRYEMKRLESGRKHKSEYKAVVPDEKDLQLPTQKSADHLIGNYLTREYINLPIFNLASFQAKYRSLWSEEEVPEDTDVFRPIVNILFALLSLALHPHKRDDAATYFGRAQNFIRPGGFNDEDIGHVQLYILASQYLVAANDLNAAWQSIGSAIRISQALGLHLSSGSQYLAQRSDRELARRLWHSCIIMERSIATNLGWSPQVSPNAFKTPLPMPLENEYIDVIFGGEPMSGTDRPSIIEFFTSLARLYERYENVVAVQEEYRITGGCSPRKVSECFDGKRVLEADRLLCNWRAALPPHLQSDNGAHPSFKNPIARRQQSVLRIRYLHMSLLLWRPLLALNAAIPDISPTMSGEVGQSRPLHSVDTPLARTLVHAGAIKCILAAREIVDIITDGKSETVTPWWENIGFAFVCANVFVAARLCPLSVHEELSDPDVIEEGWRRSIRLLEGYRVFSTEAGKCISALEDITETVLEDEGREVDGDYGSGPQLVRDMAWLECLPVDLAG